MRTKRMLALGAVFLVVIQLVPGPYSSSMNTAPSGQLLQSSGLDPTTVSHIVEACGDCHSTATRWPWYSRVAPMSWLIAKDVADGRKFLNFSAWKAYGSAGQGQLLQLAAERIKDGSMPPRRYSLLHADAEWKTKTRAMVVDALLAESARLAKLE